MINLKPVEAPIDNLRLRENNTDLYVNCNLVGKGTLYLAESCLVWISDESPGQGISLVYPSIALHAISRDISYFPHESLFLMTDADLGVRSSESSGNESDDCDMDPEPRSTKLHFVPECKESLSSLFQILYECQMLHPDPQDTFSDENEEEEEDNGSDDLEEADSQMSNMHLNQNGGNSGQFQDAEEN